jgi:hypothetical protein
MYRRPLINLAGSVAVGHNIGATDEDTLMSEEKNKNSAMVDCPYD